MAEAVTGRRDVGKYVQGFTRPIYISQVLYACLYYIKDIHPFHNSIKSPTSPYNLAQRSHEFGNVHKVPQGFRRFADDAVVHGGEAAADD